MIPEKRLKELILQCLENVRQLSPSYQRMEINDNTMVLGAGSPLDSIAFAAFAADFEEKIEDEIGHEYALKVDEIYDLEEGRSSCTVREMAELVSELLSKKYV